MTNHSMSKKKLRRCNNCGYETTCMTQSSSHKVWCAEKKKQVYCGFMRVVR